MSKRREGEPKGPHGTIHFGKGDWLPGAEGKPVDQEKMLKLLKELGRALGKPVMTDTGQYVLPGLEDEEASQGDMGRGRRR